MLVNLVFNYILIFGKFGAPALGVVGAAIATVLSRFVECAIVITWTHRHKERNRFIVGVYETMRVPPELARQIVRLGAPAADKRTAVVGRHGDAQPVLLHARAGGCLRV